MALRWKELPCLDRGRRAPGSPSSAYQRVGVEPMIAILDLSWHRFSSRSLTDPKVEDLVTLCSSESPRLFVAHDSVSGWSGVVAPQGVLALVDRLELPRDAPAFDLGLLSTLSAGQLIARWN